MYKPQVPYTPQMYKNFQTKFGGYNHTSSCGEGEIYDMKNIGHEEFPVLTPRRGRNTAPAFDNGRIFPAYSATEIVRPPILQIYSFDNAYVVEKHASYYEGLGVIFGTPPYVFWKNDDIEDFELKNLGNNYDIAQSMHDYAKAERFNLASINKYIAQNYGDAFRRDLKGIVESLDKLEAAQSSGLEVQNGDVYAVLDLENFAYGQKDFGDNGAFDQTIGIYACYFWNGSSWSFLPNRNDVGMPVRSMTFRNGTYQGEEAEANTIYCANGFPEGMIEGDGLLISGCTKQPLNNKAVVIKEISEDRKELRFYENTFTLVNDASVVEDAVTITRPAPELDFMCHCNNRLFGCKGDTIYASKLGDPYNWNVFEGISTDSYSVEVGSAGDFTACCAYDGDVLFFKEDRIYRLMYTDRSPENWSLVETETYGVKAGCDRSLAIADSCLFYYSPRGMMRYTGTLPMSVNDAFGTDEYENAVAGSDGKDYYVCLTDKAGVSTLFVFDTTHYIWLKHDEIRIIGFAYHKGDLTALVEKESGDTEVIRLGQKVMETSAEDDWFDMESMIEFGDTMNDTTNKKNKMNISVVAEVQLMSELRFYISCDGNPYEFLGEIKGPSTKQTHKFSYVPTRCDYYRLKVEGKGFWKIYAISNGYSPGSDV
ncbi:MAG: hypothetical protein IJ017_04635 [Oscillospiraceae bacterium]|nr:hypothetical protein [Oscillospiraceae bacterium]